MKPEWEPPVHLVDPFVRRLEAGELHPKRKNDGFHLWARTIRGQLPSRADIAVARTLATYGDPDGTNCRPGLANLAKDCQCSTKSVQRSLDYLDEHGWVHLANPGIRKRGEANDYTLSVPAPIAVDNGWWSDENGDQWMERPAKTPKHASGRRPQGGHRRPPKGPLGGHQDALGGHLRPVSVDTGVHPPGSTHQIISHHSASPSRPHAGARGRRITEICRGLDVDDLDIVEQLQERLEEELGYALDTGMARELEGMLCKPDARLPYVASVILNKERQTA